jgi:hypothetical protein
MIKLENPVNAPVARCVLTLESVGSTPSISVSTSEARKQSGLEWIADPLRLKQHITFIGADGDGVTLSGLVEETDAVEISGAFRVVVEVKLAEEQKGAFAAGRVGREFTALQVVRIMEIWASASRKIHSAAKVMDAGGRSLDMGTGKVA